MIADVKPNLGSEPSHTLQQVALMIARGAEPETYQAVWESLVADRYTSDAATDIEALVQSVIRESYVQSTDELQSLARKVDFYHTIRDQYRKLIQDRNRQIEDLRTLSDAIRQEIVLWEDKLDTVGDDAQLANVDLQNALQKQQQTLQMLSNISKMLNDTAMAVIRKLGG